MPPYLPRFRSAAAALAVLAATAGCTHIRDHKGYVIDQTLIDTVQPGIDNRDSVTKTLGRPSFVSQFDSGTTWYYVSRDTRQLAFASPRPSAQTLLAVNFDGAGNVAGVKKTGLEKIVNVTPSGDKTPTLGRHRNFFTELFSNIGAVGAAGTPGTTTDNPTGGKP
jgi:outer membrane protein assembly factor BamE (lipoprotein component of BamABCDE complex)